MHEEPIVTSPNEHGWSPEEVLITEPTRNSRLRWVVVVSAGIAPGEMANAVACVAAQAGLSIGGLLGPAGTDAAGGAHPGLPWAGCTLLVAPSEAIAELRLKALAAGDVLVGGMPASAQTNRVYAEYLDELSQTPPRDLGLRALSLFGPKNRIARLTGKLTLLP